MLVATAATGRIRRIDGRAQDVADDHDLLVVPAIDERARDRAEEQVRQRRREEHEPGRERGARRDQRRAPPARAGWIRSPNSEMSWPAHSAENEPLSASRTYGWRRTRSTGSRCDGRGIGHRAGPAMASGVGLAAWSDGEARPGPARCPGRAAARAATAAGGRATGRSRRPDRRRAAPAVRRGPGAADRARAAPRRAPAASVGRRAANRKKARPSVRNTSPTEATFWIDRERDRDDVARAARGGAGSWRRAPAAG